MENNQQNDFGTDVQEEITDVDSDIIVEDEAPSLEAHQDTEVHLEETPILSSKEPEDKPKVKKRSSADKRIHEIQKEKYQALDELQRIKEENEHLKKMAEISTQSAIINYDMTVKQRLDRAKQLKAQAIESGDVAAQVEADIELSSAVSELQKANDWKMQKSYQDQQMSEVYQQPPEVSNQREIQRWVNENQWMNPNSHDYNESLASKMNAATDSLDAYLFRTGQHDLRFTREYFNELDAYRSQLISEMEDNSDEYEAPVRSRNDSQPAQRRNVPMKTSNRPPVSPVRSQRPSSSGEPQRFTISNEEKEIARRMGVTDKAYVYHRETQARQRPDQRSRGDR